MCPCAFFSVWHFDWSEERFYLGDNVLACIESGVPLLKHHLHQLPDAGNMSSCSDVYLLCDYIIQPCIVGNFSSNMSSCSDVYYCVIPLFNQCIVGYFSSLVVLSTKKAGWHKYCSWKYVPGGCQIGVAFPDEGTWNCFLHKQLQYFPMVRHSIKPCPDS